MNPNLRTDGFVLRLVDRKFCRRLLGRLQLGSGRVARDSLSPRRIESVDLLRQLFNQRTNRRKRYLSIGGQPKKASKNFPMLSVVDF